MSPGLGYTYMVLFYAIVHGIGLGAALSNWWIVRRERMLK